MSQWWSLEGRHHSGGHLREGRGMGGCRSGGHLREGRGMGGCHNGGHLREAEAWESVSVAEKFADKTPYGTPPHALTAAATSKTGYRSHVPVLMPT